MPIKHHGCYTDYSQIGPCRTIRHLSSRLALTLAALLIVVSLAHADASEHYVRPITRLIDGKNRDNGSLVRDGEFFVKLGTGTHGTFYKIALSRAGGVVIKTYPAIGWQLVRLPLGTSFGRATSLLQSIVPGAAVCPNYVRRLAPIAHDRQANGQWALTKINAPQCWKITGGKCDVVVAVIDSGVDYTHPDLASNMWCKPNGIIGDTYVGDIHGIDVVNNTCDPRDDSDASHGTLTAGVIGASGIGASGVCPHVKIMALKVLNRDDEMVTDGDILTCYEYVIAMRTGGINVRVINNSWGGADYSQALLDEINTAATYGILSVCAAGESDPPGQDLDNPPPSYPACYKSDGVVCVAATDTDDKKWSESDYGQTVSLAAPGVAIYSTIRGSQYATATGTSIAAPFVSGVAAMLFSQCPHLTAAQLKADLMATAKPVGSWTASGRLDALAALQALAHIVPRNRRASANSRHKGTRWCVSVPRRRSSFSQRAAFLSPSSYRNRSMVHDSYTHRTGEWNRSWLVIANDRPSAERLNN